MTAEEYDGYKAQILGNFEGIGIVYAQKERDFIVISTYKNSPARRAGIKPGDKILSVDGKKYMALVAASTRAGASAIF